MPANTTPITSVIAAMAGAGIFNLLLELYKIRRAGVQEKSTRDTALSQAPLVKESLALGNVEKAVAIQQQIIEQQKEHIAFLDSELETLRAMVVEKNERLNRMAKDLSALQEQVQRLQEQVDTSLDDPPI